MSLYGWALFNSFSVALAQICLGLSALLTIISILKDKGKNLTISNLEVSFYLLVIAMLASSLFSLDMSRSLFASLKFLQYPVAIIGFRYCGANTWHIITALIISQTVSASHSLFEFILKTPLEVFLGIAKKSLPPGPVTESGQLVFILPLTLIYLFFYRNKLTKNQILSLGAAIILMLLAFLLNGKRGPWIGLIAQVFGLILLIKSSKNRSIFLVLGLIFLLSLMALPYTRIRLFSSIADFMISGGRNEMWRMGFDLLDRYPLGIGFHNSKFIHVLNPELPALHRHLHNNFLNIAVEMGWFGLVVFINFALQIIITTYQEIMLFFNNKKNEIQNLIITLSLFLGTIGTNIAGLVEYNFGDSEVRNILFILMGIYLSKTKININDSITKDING